MKKVLLTLFVLIMVFSLVACATPATDTGDETTEAPDEAAVEDTEDDAGDTEDQGTEDVVDDGEYDPSQVRIAVASTGRGHPVLQTVQMGFVERALELGYDPEIITIDGFDLATFFAAGEAAIADGVQGIVIMRDVAGLEFFETCAENDVPVIAVHFQINEEDGTNLMANISCDPIYYGKTCGEAMGAELVARGYEGGTVAITQGGFNTTENDAAASFMEAMQASYPQFTLLEPVEEGFDSNNGMQRQAAIIQSETDLVGAFTTTGGGANNWANAATVMGKGGGEICIIGMDYTEANLTLVESGAVFAVVAQPLVEQTALGAELLDTYFRTGEKPDKYYYELEAPLVTLDNVADYWGVVESVKEMFANYEY